VASEAETPNDSGNADGRTGPHRACRHIALPIVHLVDQAVEIDEDGTRDEGVAFVVAVVFSGPGTPSITDRHIVQAERVTAASVPLRTGVDSRCDWLRGLTEERGVQVAFLAAVEVRLAALERIAEVVAGLAVLAKLLAVVGASSQLHRNVVGRECGGEVIGAELGQIGAQWATDVDWRLADTNASATLTSMWAMNGRAGRGHARVVEAALLGVP